MNILSRTISHRAIAGGILPLLLAIGAITPAYAVLNGKGQDIFPVTSVFQSSVAITYSNAANAGLIVSSGLIVSNGDVGISTGAPQARLDVLASSTTADTMAQIWRDSNGTIISSVSATGVVTAVKFSGDGAGLTGISGDNLGGHIATATLNMSDFNIVGVSTISVSSITAPGAGVVFSTNMFVMNGSLGVGTTGPAASLDVTGGIKVGNVSALCSAEIAGTLRWKGGHLSVCNGSDWRILESLPPPSVSAISPSSGPVNGGTVITITGLGFSSGPAVSVDGVVSASVTLNSAAQITATTPAGSVGVKELRITNSDGQYCVIAFTYTPAPVIATVSPATGRQSTAITITGTSFAAGATVKIGTVAATGVTVVSDTQITATTPGGSGANDVRVTNPDGGYGVLTGGYAYMGATGGTITDVGAYRIHTFTASGTFTPAVSGNVEVLVVGGGGGGGGTGSGGGAGGYYYNASFAVTPQAYTVTIGGGGAGGSNAPGNGVKGSDSTFSTITAEGGGNGVTHGGQTGGSGGSGGGGSISTSGSAAAGGTGSQGNAGGSGYVNSGWTGNSGGGGGAGAAGTAGGNTSGSGNGGVGLANSISGSSVYYAGGGGTGEVNGSYIGTGGTGGGGSGSMNAAGSNGTANTGGGGGGGSYNGSSYFAGGTGGSGIVIIRYLR